MELEINLSNNVDVNVNSSIEKVFKCLTELQALRKENRLLKMQLTNAELSKQNLVYEVDKLRQTSKDLKGQIKTAYSVINAFNKNHGDRNNKFSHQTLMVEVTKAENTFLTEQTINFQENISKLTIEKLELLEKCQQLETNSTYFDVKYTSACQHMQSLEKSIKKLEENQQILRNLSEKLKIDVNLVNGSIKSYEIKTERMKQENQKMSQKITELFLRLPVETDMQPCGSLIEECDKLASTLACEKSKNIQLTESLAICISNQNKIFKDVNKCNKLVQTDSI